MSDDAREISIHKDQLGAELRRQISIMTNEALTDEAVETLIGPNGSEIQRRELAGKLPGWKPPGAVFDGTPGPHTDGEDKDA